MDDKYSLSPKKRYHMSDNNMGMGSAFTINSCRATNFSSMMNKADNQTSNSSSGKFMQLSQMHRKSNNQISSFDSTSKVSCEGTLKSCFNAIEEDVNTPKSTPKLEKKRSYLKRANTEEFNSKVNTISKFASFKGKNIDKVIKEEDIDDHSIEDDDDLDKSPSLDDDDTGNNKASLDYALEVERRVSH